MTGSEPTTPTAKLARVLAERRLVLFDLDDTLCDYSRARELRLARAFGDAFTASGLDSPAGLAELITRSIDIHPHGVEHFSELLRPLGVTDDAIAAAQSWYQTNRFHSLAFFAETEATLAAVRDQWGVAGRTIGIITNGPAEVQRAKIDLLGIEARVDFVVISGEFGVEKPDPAIFQEALRQAEATASESVYIGDSAEHDVAGARAAGMPVIWVNRDGGDWHGEGERPELEIRRIGDLARAITASG